ncbi:MAG TPA: hypothetical protein VHC20_05305 [Candidatus Paceibacterota bacterium]|nr:hypothetical protein [Candidatus Paceibacterota bacterium]HVX91011.1 hypothetical protein [Candidatus Paceibacterota bacterium]
MTLGKKIVVALGVCALAWLGWAIRKGDRLHDAFAIVAKGDTEARVLELFGTPKRVTGLPDTVAWGTEDSIRKNSGDCTREFWYEAPINLDGGAWTVGFDRQGRVVSKYRYSSP